MIRYPKKTAELSTELQNLRSLDDIAAAIESYCQAVRMDPSLHVCFANLATLYMYLEDFQKAEARPRGEMMIDTDHGRRRRFPTTALVVLVLATLTSG